MPRLIHLIAWLIHLTGLRLWWFLGSVGLWRSKVKFSFTWMITCSWLRPTSIAEIKVFSESCHLVSKINVKHMTFFPPRNKGWSSILIEPRCSLLQPLFLYFLISYEERIGRYIFLELEEIDYTRTSKDLYTDLSLDRLNGTIDLMEEMSVFT